MKLSDTEVPAMADLQLQDDSLECEELPKILEDNNSHTKSQNIKPKLPLTTLQECVFHRYSCRAFKPDAVSEALLRECLTLAQRAPSNSNIQNWRITIASKSTTRAKALAPLQHASRHSDPTTTPLPSEFQRHRNELVQLLYGPEGYDVQGEAHREARQAKRLLNYSFFNAPVCAVITMSRDLDFVDALSVGMFLQTFALALTQKGLASCCQVSVTQYPDALCEGFGLDPERERLLCGMAIGWPEEGRR